MPRLPRIILPEYPHHLTQRGNRKSDVFLDTEDRQIFLSLVEEYTQKNGIKVSSYCLMTNHFHLIVHPATKLGLSKGMHQIDGVYAEYFNQKYKLTGHLWQDRFFACVLDSSHFWKAVQYVERNPVRAGLVSRAEKYQWSSAAAHCGQRCDPLLSEIPLPAPHGDWRAWLTEDLPEEEHERIRRAAKRGAPYASESFIRELERLLNLRLLPRKPGPNSSS